MSCVQVAGSVLKAPGEVIDFGLDWTLPTGDSIATSACTVQSGTVAVDDVDDSGSTVTIWVSGGACGEVAELLVTITTAAGRTLQRTVFVELRS